MNRLFFSAAVLFALLPLRSFATVHELPFDTTVTVQLSDGDEIHLSYFPAGWHYTRVVLGVNAEAGGTLSGTLTKGQCAHSLSGYYQEVDFSYDGKASLTYSGPSRSLPLHWWVDTNPVTAVCAQGTGHTQEDSVNTELLAIADSLMDIQLAKYPDLGAINSETAFSGSSSRFRITRLPDSPYNLIYVQIEPTDGRPLDGAVYAGATTASLSGWSMSVVLEPQANWTPTFELTFPEYRKIRLKWWAVAQTPTQTLIDTEQTSLGGTRTRVQYDFAGSYFTPAPLTLDFDKADFVDGAVPAISKLSHTPLGMPPAGDAFTIAGPMYDIHAQLIPGRTVTVALPVEMSYSTDEDSLMVQHFNADENRWEDVAVDSIVGNYAYFQASSFSKWHIKRRIRNLGHSVSSGAKTVGGWIKKGGKEMVKVVCTIAGGAVELVKWTADNLYEFYKYTVSSICSGLSFDTWKDIFTHSGGNWNWWDLDQGGGVSSLPPQDSRWLTSLNTLAGNTLTPLSTSSSESGQWAVTAHNLDILLADLILAQRGEETQRRYSISASKKGSVYLLNSTTNIAYPLSDYLLEKSSLLEDIALYIDFLKTCYSTLNVDGAMISEASNLVHEVRSLNMSGLCKDVLTGFGIVDYTQDVLDCSLDFTTILAKAGQTWGLKGIFSDGNDRDAILQNMSEVMLRVSLLSWLDKDNYRLFLQTGYIATYDALESWLSLANPMYGYNNISIKANASLALFEYIQGGTDDNLQEMNKGMRINYGDNGGFSEGTGYSQYIWDDVPYLLVALKAAHESSGESMDINEKFLKSPYYMRDISRPVRNIGLIPVEADDGCTYNPDYLVWGKLLGDPSLVALAKQYPVEPTKFSPLLFLGVPDASTAGTLPEKGSLWGGFSDGVGTIQTVWKYTVDNAEVTDTVALSLIAESRSHLPFMTDGDLLTNGQGHDQQDNTSFTLSSSWKGFIVQDRGYSGYGDRPDDNFHHFWNHNVLTRATGSGCVSSAPSESCLDKDEEDDNSPMSVNDFANKAAAFSGEQTGILASTTARLLNLFGFNWYGIRFAGGEDAWPVDSIRTDGILGYTAYHKTSMGLEDNRTILSFGGTFWVIDRPAATVTALEILNPHAPGTVWLANSPKDQWKNLGISLYGSGTDAKTGTGVNENIKQNGSRADYDKDVPTNTEWLHNFWYAIQDPSALTYAMTYSPPEGAAFTKTEDNCPSGSQCFRNPDGSARLVIPPRGASFTLSAAFDDCLYDGSADGIVMGTYDAAKRAWTFRVIDGDLRIRLNGGTASARTVTVGDGVVVYTDADGTAHSEAYTAYLPAIPLLLLR